MYPATPGSGGVTFTLSVLLEKAGYRTAPHGGDLLVTGTAAERA